MAKNKLNLKSPIVILVLIVLAFFIIKPKTSFIGSVTNPNANVNRAFGRTDVYTNEEFTVTYTPSGWLGTVDHFWQIVQPLPGSGWKVNGVVKTDINRFSTDQDTATYTLTAPSTAGTYNFAGQFAVDSETLDSFSVTPIIVTACTITTETCNNVDDDCDHSIDESLTQGTTCGVGACSNNIGIETCTAGIWGGDTCNPLAGAITETCNNVDDDCDGTTDESLTKQCGVTNVGPCQYGISTCGTGIWGSCVGNIDPATEICNSGIDEDCNGNSKVSNTIADDPTYGNCNCKVESEEVTAIAFAWISTGVVQASDVTASAYQWITDGGTLC